MPLRKDKVKDVLSVLTEIRNEYISNSGDRNTTDLRKKAIKRIAKNELQLKRFKNIDSAEKTIHDACARRLQFDIVDIDDFDDLVDEWLRNNSMRLKTIFWEHSKNKLQQEAVDAFFKDSDGSNTIKATKSLIPLTASIIPEEISESNKLYEGSVRTILVNAYERNRAARDKCIKKYGCKCSACGVVLADVYGAIADGYIHVHHLRPLSEINETYEVDPIQDLRPICPNCHVIVHMKNPPYTIEEVKKLIDDQNSS